MKKKILSILAIMFVVLVSFTNVQAADGLFQMGAFEDIYKLSEQLDEIDLPFINVFTNAATYDKDVNHSGISVGTTTIDVNEKLEGMQLLVSKDMVTIKGEVENSVIYANNIVIEGKITGDTILLAPTVQILETATIEKDVIIVANNLELQGTVKGNVIATVAVKANISGTIEKDLRMVALDLSLQEEQINGEVYLETDADTSAIIAKYPDATIQPLEEETESTIDWIDIFTKGVITVIVYSAICFFITRKDNNIAEQAYNKFKANTTYGLIISIVMLMLLILLPILLVVLAFYGFGIIAWPILIAYLGGILLVLSTASLIVGMTIFEAVKGKVGKYKIPVIALIFIVLYALTKITFISTYANMAMLLIALGIVVTMITKKLPDDKKEKTK